jgi:hypothetical protein
MIRLQLLYYGIIYGYTAVMGICMTLIFTTLNGLTDCSYWLLAALLFLPLIMIVIMFLGGFSYSFSMDLYRRYNTFRVIRGLKQIEKDQQGIRDMLDKLKNQ